ncbi:MAG: VOC family protein [Pseudomonadales bacterium]|nr:VOC family protein [Pseudomonadales bacterium]
MSRIFGPIAQNGYVVPDLDAAIEHWANKLGVGPWFEMDTSIFEEMVYRGEVTDMRVRIALANSGDLQIELIEPIDERPSPYRDFLQDNGGRGGLQHVSSWPTSQEFDTLIETHRVAFSGRGGGTRFAYFADVLDFGTMMEIADLTRGTRAYFGEIKAAAVQWDGKSPRA